MTAELHDLTTKKNISKAEGLLHSLVPRAQCFCFYDNDRECVWSSDGAEDYEIDKFAADLPDEIIDRKKRGFGAPIGGWFKRELADYLDLVLNERSVRERGIFDWEHLQHLKTLHRANREDYTDHLLALVNFELWCKLYLDGDSPDDITGYLQPAAA